MSQLWKRHRVFYNYKGSTTHNDEMQTLQIKNCLSENTLGAVVYPFGNLSSVISTFIQLESSISYYSIVDIYTLATI